MTPPPVDPFGGDDGGPPERPKLKKLRIALVGAGLGFIAFISVIFGMMMAVASEVPNLENEVRFRNAENSILYADSDEEYQLAKLTGNENRILVDEEEISPYIKNAVIAIEDKRFYEHRGVDYRGIARALYQDILQRRRRTGRLHDHPAVREERARGAGRPLGVPESSARRQPPTTSSESGRSRRS